MALYIVGDVHGCIDELRLLLEKVNFDPQQDQLWSVGDLVGRGPHSKNVLEFVVELGRAFRCVLGNHDLHLLAVLCGIKPANPKDNTDPIHQGNEQAFWINWLRQQPLMLQSPDYKLAMVHAGIYPEWSLNQAQKYADEVSLQLQSDDFTQYLAGMYHNEPTTWQNASTSVERFRFIVNAFTRIRYCEKQGSNLHLELTCKLPPAQARKSLQPWFNFWPKQSIQVIFGHWAALNGQTNRTDIVALDTGCVWGNTLTLMNATNGRLITQDALN